MVGSWHLWHEVHAFKSADLHNLLAGHLAHEVAPILAVLHAHKLKIDDPFELVLIDQHVVRGLILVE